MTETKHTHGLPLAGLRVVEFAHAVMGPCAGLLLADLGAEVIHVEPLEGDATRQLGGFGSGYFGFYNRNKVSFAVDLKTSQGLELARKLVATADVLVENFGPGTLERLGLGAAALCEAHPKLVYCALKGFLSGPYENRHAMDEVVQMMSGLAYMTGPRGRPLRAGASIVDVAGGMFGVVGILAALHDRHRTGRGGIVKASLFETAAFLMGQHMAHGALSGEPLPPMPERQSAWSVYQVFDTREAGEPVFLGLVSDAHWRRFCEAFDGAAWASDPALATNAGRIAAKDVLLPAIAARLASLPRKEILARCEAATVPCSPVATPEDLFHDPQLAHPGRLLDVELPPKTSEHAPVAARLPALPLTLDGRTPPLRAQPPAPGNATRSLLAELGYSADAIAGLERDHIVTSSSEPRESATAPHARGPLP